jgi:glycosyltransferase involved in cell wall biosynthesis
MPQSIIVVCPDTNIKLWATRTRDAAIGGGKSAILQLAKAWARAGSDVTIAGRLVIEERAEGITLVNIERVSGSFDVGIYVTGSLQHFDVEGIALVDSRIRLLWINSPNQIAPPPGRLPDLYVAPARFLARRAIDEWGFAADRVVVIPGESAMASPARDGATRDPLSVVYASHPFKGLGHAVELVSRVRPDYPELRLDVYGSAALWGDDLTSADASGYPEWVSIKGGVAQEDVAQAMASHGVMLYITTWRDGFSLATAEALAGGVIVIATDHGANAEFIRHGWNGFLVSVNERHEPDLDQAERLLRHYLARPGALEDMRKRAADSVPSWDEQAAQWERAWQGIVR